MIHNPLPIDEVLDHKEAKDENLILSLSGLPPDIIPL
jgi:hypothetical protein